MGIPVVLQLLLLGHVLGDFYFQGDTNAERKDVGFAILLGHGAVYTLCMAAVLFIGLPFSLHTVLLCALSSALHLVFDYLKRHIRKKAFIIDQILHILSLAGIALLLFGLDLPSVYTWDFLQYSLPQLPAHPLLTVLLGLLIQLRPIGFLIAKGDIWNFSKRSPAQSNVPNDRQKGAGRMIGYLERMIVYFFLLHGQLGAIGFVIAAKSVARFPEISNCDDPSLAEYYLIGTLLSMLSVFFVAFLLGLTRF